MPFSKQPDSGLAVGWQRWSGALEGKPRLVTLRVVDVQGRLHVTVISAAIAVKKED